MCWISSRVSIVYRVRLSVNENSSRIDKAFETLFNIPFYALVATMILIQLDFDPLAVSVAVRVSF
jgi:hypothetical protein